MNNSTLQIIKENEELKRKLKLYEISTKLDYEKIQKLKDEIIYLKSKMRLEPNTNKII
jgi:hypothetical protein